MMNLHHKIEEIRQKPEHIRVRYVWAMVGISMAIVIGIWFISLKAEKNRLFPDNSSEQLINTD